jgi:hypothetical protein
VLAWSEQSLLLLATSPTLGNASHCAASSVQRLVFRDAQLFHRFQLERIINQQGVKQTG